MTRRRRSPQHIDDARLRMFWGTFASLRLIADIMDHRVTALRRRGIKIGLPLPRPIKRARR